MSSQDISLTEDENKSLDPFDFEIDAPSIPTSLTAKSSSKVSAPKKIYASISSTQGPRRKMRVHVSYADYGVDPKPEDYMTQAAAVKLARSFTFKAEKRLQTFVAECRRSKKKIAEIFKALEDAGYTIKNFALSKSEKDQVHNKRRRMRNIQFDIEATREQMTLSGYLLVKPCTVNLFLAATSMAYEEPVVHCKYYRNLIFRDNYLAALVKGVPLQDWRTVNNRFYQ